MRKTLLLSLLALAIVCSITAGTLASYTVTIDLLANGSVQGKEFIFVEDGMDTFEQSIKIAPGETVKWQFAVKNYRENKVTETDLYYQLTFDIHASAGRSAIDPLVFTVIDREGIQIETLNGMGKLVISGSFPLSNDGQSDSYTLQIDWPQDDAIDGVYAGTNFGTSILVAGLASQLPIEQQEPIPEGIKVVYSTQTPWTEGAVWDPVSQSLVGGTKKHGFKVTIYNDTGDDLAEWEIQFLLQEDIYNTWNASVVYENNATGDYRFQSMDYNKAIPKNGSVSFEGQAIGDGSNPIGAVKVNGKTAVVECLFHTY